MHKFATLINVNIIIIRITASASASAPASVIGTASVCLPACLGLGGRDSGAVQLEINTYFTL